MAKKPGTNPKGEFAFFDVVYEDGSQRSNRRVPSELLGGLEGDEPARGYIIEQDREIAEKSGRAPLKIVFQLDANLPRPVQSWQLVFGDGLQNQGSGKPPHFAGHTYEKAGAYRAILIVYEAPAVSGTVVRFYTIANITVT